MYRFKSDFLGVIRIADGLVVSFDDSDPNKAAFDEWAADNLPAQPEYTPEELQAKNADAPIQPLTNALEWFQDSRVDMPQLIDGAWVRPTTIVDLRVLGNLAMLKDRLRARLADARYQHEVGGVAINGVLVKTDRESQATITGAYARASVNPATMVSWKADNGFVALDAEAIAMFGDAVFDHVQGCFSRERHLARLIDNAKTVESLMAIDIDVGWSGA